MVICGDGRLHASSRGTYLEYGDRGRHWLSTRPRALRPRFRGLLQLPGTRAQRGALKRGGRCHTEKQQTGRQGNLGTLLSRNTPNPFVKSSPTMHPSEFKAQYFNPTPILNSPGSDKITVATQSSIHDQRHLLVRKWEVYEGLAFCSSGQGFRVQHGDF